MGRVGALVFISLLIACGNTTKGASLGNGDAAVGGDGGVSNTGGGAGTGATGETGGIAGNGGSAASGATAGSGGVTLGGADGSMDAAIPCSSVDDCPPSASACRAATCDSTCRYELLRAGPAPNQVDGDCRQVYCEIDGATNTVVDDTDSDDLNPCTSDACTNGLAMHTVLTDTPCNNGAGICDAFGRCIECTADSDCGTSTQCTSVLCVDGTCSIEHAPAGSFCEGSVSDQCDGAGNCFDCVDSNGCDTCCVCIGNICLIP